MDLLGCERSELSLFFILRRFASLGITQYYETAVRDNLSPGYLGAQGINWLV